MKETIERYSDYHRKDRKIIWVDKDTKERLKKKAADKGLTLKDFLTGLVQK